VRADQLFLGSASVTVLDGNQAEKPKMKTIMLLAASVNCVDVLPRGKEAFHDYASPGVESDGLDAGSSD
jgi:hypothetical protein